jgi:1-phosphatidylinositol-3-phosphate 5-kinase
LYRIQAIAIGQALFEAGFIEPVLLDSAFYDSAALFKPAKLSQVQSKDFLIESQTSCDAQEPAWVKTIPQHDSTIGKYK